MASLARAPADLQPRWWHLPRLAWVVARAFLGTRLPGRVAAVWAISPAAFVYLPLLVSAACRRHLAASPDHTAVVVVWTGLRDRLTLLTVGLLEILAVIAAVNIGLDLTFALAQVTTLTGLVVAALTLGTALTVILLPAMVEATVMLRHRFTPTSALAETYTAQLRRTGHTARIIGPWAAWPPADTPAPPSPTKYCTKPHPTYGSSRSPATPTSPTPSTPAASSPHTAEDSYASAHPQARHRPRPRTTTSPRLFLVTESAWASDRVVSPVFACGPKIAQDLPYALRRDIGRGAFNMIAMHCGVQVSIRPAA